MNDQSDKIFFANSNKGAVDLADREREIFRLVVDAYIETGQPLGSRTLSRQLSQSLSPASIRNVMSDLEHLGLIFSPHTSAGRMPTETGLRFFVDSFMEFGAPSSVDQKELNHQLGAISEDTQNTPEQLFTQASEFLSGLAGGAGLVMVGKTDMRIKHIEFVGLDKFKALVILVGEDGSVENRVVDVPAGTTSSQLTSAANWMNANIAGQTLAEARSATAELLAQTQSQLDSLAKQLVSSGLATWSGANEDAAGDFSGQLIVRGRSRLLEDLQANEDLERARQLFDDLEAKRDIVSLINQAEGGEGVRIFIGSENKLFSLSGSSVIVAPYKDAEQQVVGAVGVIGPTRLNYRRIVPMVDYTAQIVSRVLNNRLR